MANRYTDMMEIRRATYGAAIRLAMALSVIASVVAMGLHTVGDVSTVNLVAIVAVVGFTMSWVQTGRVRRAVATRPAHRVTMMPVRQPIG